MEHSHHILFLTTPGISTTYSTSRTLSLDNILLSATVIFCRLHRASHNNFHTKLLHVGVLEKAFQDVTLSFHFSS
ncbi:hypothetical protein C4D26_07460 [Clostridium perfringens]|nr:hypothetical protein [Clostridium perfringens]